MQDLVNSYLHLTKEILPSLARSSRQDWPVREDHCFQRIVLDTICNGVWYEHLDRPAYKNLTHDEVQRAVDLCYEIANSIRGVYTYRENRVNMAKISLDRVDTFFDFVAGSK